MRIRCMSAGPFARSQRDRRRRRSATAATTNGSWPDCDARHTPASTTVDDGFSLPARAGWRLPCRQFRLCAPLRRTSLVSVASRVVVRTWSSPCVVVVFSDRADLRRSPVFSCVREFFLFHAFREPPKLLTDCCFCRRVRFFSVFVFFLLLGLRTAVGTGLKRKVNTAHLINRFILFSFTIRTLPPQPRSNHPSQSVFLPIGPRAPLRTYIINTHRRPVEIVYKCYVNSFATTL